MIISLSLSVMVAATLPAWAFLFYGGKIIKKPTALKQIKLYCQVYCMNNQSKEILLYTSKNCLFYHIHIGKKEKGYESIKLLKQIKLYYIDCSDGSRNIKNCTFTDCPLFIYRFGHNPALKGKRGNKSLRTFKIVSTQ